MGLSSPTILSKLVILNIQQIVVLVEIQRDFELLKYLVSQISSLCYLLQIIVFIQDLSSGTLARTHVFFTM